MEGRVHEFQPGTGHKHTFEVGQFVGTVVPRADGDLMLAVQNGFASLDLATGRLEIVHDPEADLPGNRFNDGKCDPAGRFWAGTMAMEGNNAGRGSLYVLEAGGKARKALAGVSISNGIVWSLDNTTMYYIDTPTQRVDAFDYDLDSGAIGNRRTAITIPVADGAPDGMTIDAEGMLWVAHWGGWRVTRWDPQTGAQLQTLKLPVSQVTSCAFGGPDLDELYITSARIGLDKTELARQPLAGALFRARLGVTGILAHTFAG
jgi:sugar lactone lactonase YvrE